MQVNFHRFQYIESVPWLISANGKIKILNFHSIMLFTQLSKLVMLFTQLSRVPVS